MQQQHPSVVRHLDIPPLSAHAFPLDKGCSLRITDIKGGQPGDLVAFQRSNLAVRFSQARTRVENRSVTLTAGGALWSNTQPPQVMLRITEDTAGGHDLLYAPCCRYALEKRFGVSRQGCLEHLGQALAPWHVGPLDMPDPLNLFFHVVISPGGELAIGQHLSAPGSHVTLLAETDCLIAVSTCSVPLKGKANSGFTVEILAPA